jgi:arsenate reductase (thioredoxin)
MYSSILHVIKELMTQFDVITPQRKNELEQIAQYVLHQEKSAQQASLVYICTHNSRRSHFGQVWAQVAAHHYGFEQVQTYSGGTEATAFHPNAIQALRTMGFVIQSNEAAVNPRYEVFFSDRAAPVACFSKRYDDVSNPQDDFCAVMTCTDADEHCPFIPGAKVRVATPYEDPKISDDTERQEDLYMERSRQIARECLYLFSTIKK